MLSKCFGKNTIRLFGIKKSVIKEENDLSRINKIIAEIRKKLEREGLRQGSSPIR